jgi:hypothetical protein
MHAKRSEPVSAGTKGEGGGGYKSFWLGLGALQQIQLIVVSHPQIEHAFHGLKMDHPLHLPRKK